MQVELRQRDGAHLRLRDQPALRPRLGEHVVRVAEAAQLRARARHVRPVRLALQDQHVERVELHLADVGQLALGDAFVRAAEVLADVGAEVVDAAREQFARDASRRVRLAGEQADRLGGANLVEHVFERAGREVGQVGFFPGLLDAGEGELHAADVRHDLEAVLAELVAEVAGDAVEERVAAGDDRDAASCRGWRAASSTAAGRSAPIGTRSAASSGKQPQRRIGAEDHLRGAEEFTRADREPGRAVGADANDRDSLRCHGSHGTCHW